MEVRGRGRLYTYRYTVTTRIGLAVASDLTPAAVRQRVAPVARATCPLRRELHEQADASPAARGAVSSTARGLKAST